MPRSLSADVWGRVFRCGDLSAADARRLVATSRAVREALLCDQALWRRLFHQHWGRVLREWALPGPRPQRWSCVVLEFLAVSDWVQARLGAPGAVVAELVGTLAHRSLYVPVVVRLLHEHETALFDAIAGMLAEAAEIGLAGAHRLARVANAAMFRHALDYFRARLGGGSGAEPQPHLPDIELACVKLSLFDADCYRYMGLRTRKLAEIEARLASAARDQARDQAHVTIEQGRAHPSPVLRFDSLAAYREYIVDLATIVAACFNLDHLVPLRSAPGGLGMLAMDDYSIVRLYAGVSVASPFLVLVVVHTALRRYFARYQVYAGGVAVAHRSHMSQHCLVFPGLGCLFALYTVTGAARRYSMRFDGDDRLRAYFRSRGIPADSAALFLLEIDLATLVRLHFSKDPAQIGSYVTHDADPGAYARPIDEAQYRVAAAALGLAARPPTKTAAHHRDALVPLMLRPDMALHMPAVASVLSAEEHEAMAARILEGHTDHAGCALALSPSRAWLACSQRGLFVQNRRHERERGIVLGHKDETRLHYVVAMPGRTAVWKVESAVTVLPASTAALLKWLHDVGLGSIVLQDFDRVLVSGSQVRFL